MPDLLLPLTDDEANALALALVSEQDGRTPEQWLKDKLAWALLPVLDRYQTARADVVLTALAAADPDSSVKDLQATIAAASAAKLPAPVVKPPAIAGP